MNILFIGDIVGRSGRRALRKFLPKLQREYNIDLVIANGENAAGGFGITEKVARELYDYGIDCITMGNHTWNNKDIFNFIKYETNLVRPLNYPPGVPGQGWTIIHKNNYKVGVVNLLGQVYMEQYNSPVTTFEQFYPEINKISDFIVVDFHAEATGEKLAFANSIDGKVACVVGTHTHVQTNDEKILEKGTGYITDLGLTGAVDSILGMKKEKVVEKYITKLPNRFEVATGSCQLAGLVTTIDEKTGLTTNIKKILKKD